MSSDMPGLLIAFDGLDCSGKATQTDRLVRRLRYTGFASRLLQTPDYSTSSGQELKLRLQNKIGNWADTPWEDKMKYFGNNRAEHREEVVNALNQGEMVVYDRYVPSSLAFITVEALRPQEGDDRRIEVQKAVAAFEYTDHNMPKEDVSIFLDVPADITFELLSKRKEYNEEHDEYTDQKIVQQRLYNEYDLLCNSNPEHYIRIKCTDGNELLAVEDVSELIWTALLERFPQLHHKHNI